MKVRFLICCILAVALFGISCASEAKIGVSVAEVDNGAMIKNIGDVDCLIIVTSPEGEQEFELAVGASVTVTYITPPIEVRAVSL